MLTEKGLRSIIAVQTRGAWQVGLQQRRDGIVDGRLNRRYELSDCSSLDHVGAAAKGECLLHSARIGITAKKHDPRFGVAALQKPRRGKSVHGRQRDIKDDYGLVEALKISNDVERVRPQRDFVAARQESRGHLANLAVVVDYQNLVQKTKPLQVLLCHGFPPRDRPRMEYLVQSPRQATEADADAYGLNS